MRLHLHSAVENSLWKENWEKDGATSLGWLPSGSRDSLTNLFLSYKCRRILDGWPSFPPGLQRSASHLHNSVDQTPWLAPWPFPLLQKLCPWSLSQWSKDSWLCRSWVLWFPLLSVSLVTSGLLLPSDLGYKEKPRGNMWVMLQPAPSPISYQLWFSPETSAN